MIDPEHVQLLLTGFAIGFGTALFLERLFIPIYARWLLRTGRITERRRGGRARR